MMRLIIISMAEAVLDAENLKVLFIKSHPVAAVKKLNDKDRWTAYQTSSQDKDTMVTIKTWLDGYISNASDLMNLDMEALMEILKRW